MELEYLVKYTILMFVELKLSTTKHLFFMPGIEKGNIFSNIQNTGS